MEFSANLNTNRTVEDLEMTPDISKTHHLVFRSWKLLESWASRIVLGITLPGFPCLVNLENGIRDGSRELRTQLLIYELRLG